MKSSIASWNTLDSRLCPPTPRNALNKISSKRRRQQQQLPPSTQTIQAIQANNPTPQASPFPNGMEISTTLPTTTVSSSAPSTGRKPEKGEEKEVILVDTGTGTSSSDGANVGSCGTVSAEKQRKRPRNGANNDDDQGLTGQRPGLPTSSDSHVPVPNPFEELCGVANGDILLKLLEDGRALSNPDVSKEELASALLTVIRALRISPQREAELRRALVDQFSRPDARDASGCFRFSGDSAGDSAADSVDAFLGSFSGQFQHCRPVLYPTPASLLSGVLSASIPFEGPRPAEGFWVLGCEFEALFCGRHFGQDRPLHMGALGDLSLSLDPSAFSAAAGGCQQCFRKVQMFSSRYDSKSEHMVRSRLVAGPVTAPNAKVSLRYSVAVMIATLDVSRAGFGWGEPASRTLEHVAAPSDLSTQGFWRSMSCWNEPGSKSGLMRSLPVNVLLEHPVCGDRLRRLLSFPSEESISRGGGARPAAGIRIRDMRDLVRSGFEFQTHTPDTVPAGLPHGGDALVRVSLRPHQRVGVAWMLARERTPFWTAFACELPTLPRRLFYAPMYRQVALFPGNASGGLVLDEMGTGKTFTVLGTVLCDLERQRAARKSAGESDGGQVPLLGTLVVAPTTMVGQWIDETGAISGVRTRDDRGRLQQQQQPGQSGQQQQAPNRRSKKNKKATASSKRPSKRSRVVDGLAASSSAASSPSSSETTPEPTKEEEEEAENRNDDDDAVEEGEEEENKEVPAESGLANHPKPVRVHLAKLPRIAALSEASAQQLEQMDEQLARMEEADIVVVSSHLVPALEVALERLRETRGRRAPPPAAAASAAAASSSSSSTTPPPRPSFYRIVFDEAHALGKPTTRTFISCARLQSSRKWALTGTPCVRGVGDLWHLLDLISVPSAFRPNVVRDELDNDLTTTVDACRLDRRCAFFWAIHQFAIRRTTHTVVGGEPVLIKLGFDHRNVAVTLADEDKLAYDMSSDAILQCDRKDQALVLRQWVERLRASTGVARLSPEETERWIAMLEDIRKSIARTGGGGGGAAADRTVGSVVLAFAEALKKRAKNLNEGARIAIENLQAGREESCKICLDLLESPAMTPCNHIFCFECIAHAIRAQRKCPFCRKALTERDLLRLEADPEEEEQDVQTPAAAATTSTSSGQGPETLASPSGSRAPEGLFGPKMRKLIELFREWRRTDLSSTTPDNNNHTDKDAGASPFFASPSSSHSLRSSRDHHHGRDASAAAAPGRSNNKGASLGLLVFTHFNSTARDVVRALRAQPLAAGSPPPPVVARVDGTTSQATRAKAFADFQEGRADVLVLTLRSCSAGINLTSARRMVFLEACIHPDIRQQAIDRVCRMGQRHRLDVTTLYAADTIEAKIVESSRPWSINQIVEAVAHERRRTAATSSS